MKLRKSLKDLLNFCKLQIDFECQKEISNSFHFKDGLPFDLVSEAVYKYTCGRCNPSYYDETERHLKVRSGKQIGISPLTFKKNKPSKERGIHDCLLNCTNIRLLGILPIWQTEITNSFMKSKKARSLNEIDQL